MTQTRDSIAQSEEHAVSKMIEASGRKVFREKQLARSVSRRTVPGNKSPNGIKRNAELVVEVEGTGPRKRVCSLPTTHRAVVNAQAAGDGLNTAGALNEIGGGGLAHGLVLAFSTFSVNGDVGRLDPSPAGSRHSHAMSAPNPQATRLKTLRELRNLDQIEVAVAVGIARSTLAGIEAGHSPPGRDTMMALAGFYGVSLDWLATGQGDMTPGKAAAQTEDEALLLFAFRQMPVSESKPLLQMLLSRVGKSAS